MESLIVPAADDFHVHLRQGPLMHAVVPMLRNAGVGVALVMPNLQPPITDTRQALEYRAKLQSIDSSLTYLMTLYLSPSLTPDEIRVAATSGIVAVKSYPRGVTTNSEQGIEDYQLFYPVFQAMQESGMVLCLHGEVPSNAAKDICVMNAEQAFLEHLRKLHADFPKLKIVLEHATTRAAVETVKELGDTVACTITVHHLELTVDDWAGQVHNFCKPVAKFPSDRAALRQVIREGHPRFFLGSDSAPHPKHSKHAPKSCAGVFTGGYILPYLAHILEEFGALEQLIPFGCERGRAFYSGTVADVSFKNQVRRQYKLIKTPCVVQESFIVADTDIEGKNHEVVPFMAGQQLNWTIEEMDE